MLGTLLVARRGSSAPKGLGSWRTWGGGAVSRLIPAPQAKLTYCFMVCFGKESLVVEL